MLENLKVIIDHRRIFIKNSNTTLSAILIPRPDLMVEPIVRIFADKRVENSNDISFLYDTIELAFHKVKIILHQRGYETAMDLELPSEALYV